MDVVLYEPEIPPNTGTISRLCAGFEIPLHLIKPLGFSLEDKQLKRAGLDYWEYVDLRLWESYQTFMQETQGQRKVYTSTKYGVPLHTFLFYATDMLVFGPETRGLPIDILEEANTYDTPTIVNIATRKEIRSLNLALTVGIVLYQAMRSANIIYQKYR